MTFKKWLEGTGLSISAFARSMQIERNTVIRMLKNAAPSAKIRLKLMARTKKMPTPLTYELMEKMFSAPKKSKKSKITLCYCEECQG